MRTVLVILASLLLATEAQAISRHQTERMDCADVRATLQREGAAILRWTSKRTAGLPLYGRYVSDRRFCDGDEYAAPASVPAADTPSCQVRQCKRIEFDRRPILFLPFGHD